MHAAKFVCAATAILFGAIALESTAAAQTFVPYHEDPAPNTGPTYNWITNCYDAPGGTNSFCPHANVAPSRRSVPAVDPCFIAQNAMRPCKPKPVPQVGVWGAIATAPNMGWGSIGNRPTEAAARAEAIRLCQSKNPGSICKVAVAVPDACVALAMSDADNISRISGPIGAVDVAENNAMLQCQRAGGRSCVIKKSLCADGINHVSGGNTEFVNGHPIHVPQGGGRPFGRRM
jgi:hypothetical protein